MREIYIIKTQYSLVEIYLQFLDTSLLTKLITSVANPQYFSNLHSKHDFNCMTFH